MNPDMRLVNISFGNAYGPNGVLGRYKIDITTQDNATRVMMELQQLDTVRVWTATLKLEAEQSVWDALAKSDFPDTEKPGAVAPDTTMCEISAVHPELFPVEIGISLPLQTLQVSPGYKELLDILNSIIHQVSDGAIQGTHDPLGEIIISDARLNHTETITDI